MGEAVNEPCVDHNVLSRWERDSATLSFSRRCARCGTVVRRLTQRELDAADPLDVPAALLGHVTRNIRR